jgi:hypothetical protein
LWHDFRRTSRTAKEIYPRNEETRKTKNVFVKDIHNLTQPAVSFLTQYFFWEKFTEGIKSFVVEIFFFVTIQ